MQPADRYLIRALNRATVLDLIRQRGPISRATVSRLTGLSQVTVGTITAELIRVGLISEGEPESSTGGRPATPLRLNPGSFYAVGIKLMEDHLVGAVTDLESEPLGSAEAPLPSSLPESVLEAAAGLVDHLLEITGLDRSRLLGVGIGMAGVIDGEKGICHYSPFLKWQDVAVTEIGERIIGAPVLVDNDVNTLALAERWFGVGHEVDNFLLVTLGRGLGLGVVVDGRLYRGSHGGAGEFGHTVVDASSRPCQCGNIGCLEATVAEPALLDSATALLKAEGQVVESAEDVYDLVPRVPALAELFTAAGQMLGQGLANLVNVLAPELIILSGEGMRAWELLLDPLHAELERRVFHGLRGSFRLEVEPLPDAAWARGAASLVLGEIFELPTHTRTDLLWSNEIHT